MKLDDVFCRILPDNTFDRYIAGINFKGFFDVKKSLYDLTLHCYEEAEQCTNILLRTQSNYT